MPGSNLKNLLQTKDDSLAASLGAPAVRFVERVGDKIIDLVRQNNPWVSEGGSDRKDCLPCKGRLELGQEAELWATAKVTRQDPGPQPPEGPVPLRE